MTKAPLPKQISELLAPQEPCAPLRLINSQRATPRPLFALVRRLAFLAASEAFPERVDRIPGPLTAKAPAPGERKP